MTGAGSGGGGGYDYVEASYPSGADEGESLYHLTENAAFVYSGSEWIEQTVTDHSQLSGVNEGDHRSDSRVSDLAPVQSVGGLTGAVDLSGEFMIQTGPVEQIESLSYSGSKEYTVSFQFTEYETSRQVFAKFDYFNNNYNYYVEVDEGDGFETVENGAGGSFPNPVEVDVSADSVTIRAGCNIDIGVDLGINAAPGGIIKQK